MFHDQRKKSRRDVAHRAVNDTVRPAVPVRGGVPGDDALDDLVRTLRDERGLAAATLHEWSCWSPLTQVCRGILALGQMMPLC